MSVNYITFNYYYISFKEIYGAKFETNFNTIVFENIYQIYGEQSLQNGRQRRIKKTWTSFFGS